MEVVMEVKAMFQGIVAKLTSSHRGDDGTRIDSVFSISVF